MNTKRHNTTEMCNNCKVCVSSSYTREPIIRPGLVVQSYTSSYLDLTAPGGQHLGVQMWAWPAPPHFCHVGPGRGQELCGSLHADAKASSR